MGETPGNSQEAALVGVLNWNDFEGGFWSIDLEETHPVCGDRVVLRGVDPADLGLASGARVRARATPQPEQIGFQMSGTYVDVLELAPAG